MIDSKVDEYDRGTIYFIYTLIWTAFIHEPSPPLRALTMYTWRTIITLFKTHDTGSDSYRDLISLIEYITITTLVLFQWTYIGLFAGGSSLMAMFSICFKRILSRTTRQRLFINSYSH